MVPTKFEKTTNDQTKVFVNDEEYGVYDTVLLAIGRTGLGRKLNLENAGIKWNEKSGKIYVI
jgi:pyruvate/2-oxoglutarate dehydrogenase complex dihydrolipoamide dehydrogenase (E3) component